MKNRYISVLPLLFVALSASALQTELINETLTNVFEQSSDPLPLHPEGYASWDFNNCYAVSDGAIYVQVGSKDSQGSIVLPPLTGVRGNVRISMDICTYDIESKVYLTVEDGQGRLHNTLLEPAENLTWTTMSTLLEGATEATRIKIYNNYNSDKKKKRFEVRNIRVYDIGDNIYYESFDRNNGTGGNDGRFGLPNASVMDNPVYDYTGSSKQNVYRGNKCLFYNGSSGATVYYQTSTLTPLFNTKGTAKVILSYRMAGNKTNPMAMTVSSGTGVGISDATAQATYGTWTTHEATLTNYNGSVIKLSCNDIFLDDVAVREVATKDFILDEAAATTDGLASVKGYVANVTLQRTLRANIWNTLCLPFDFSLSRGLPAEMQDMTVSVMRLKDVVDGVFQFHADTAVPAGEPFLLRVGSEVENPVFADVPVRVSSPSTLTFDSYGFAGTFCQTALLTNGENLFLGIDGNLYQPSEEDHNIGGLRAYFTVPVGEQARVAMVTDDVTPVVVARMEPGVSSTPRLVSLQGQVLSGRSLRKGLYIKDGRKYVVR